jgi:uncharacterized protein (DUF362 family)
MSKPIVAIVRYEKPLESVRKATDLCGGLDRLPANARCFIKPNIVFWTRATPFPKWGVITTSRVVEDMVVLLKERGIADITIGEGTVTLDPRDRETPAHAFETLGYGALQKRYGVECVNIFERPFEKVDLGAGVVLNYNVDILQSDFVINLPVLKTHAQTVVSLGIKNLKGMIDITSRKKCHSADPEMDLHYMVARLANRLPPSYTLLDGIYTNARGPSFDGRIRRSNVPYNEEGTLPRAMDRRGIKGLSYRKYDLSLCTYCAGLTGVILTAIAYAWQGEPWEDVEVLTGKVMEPSPGKKKTILIGKCMVQANKDHADIQEMIAVKGCPPSPEAITRAFHRAGIEVNPAIFEHIDAAPAYFSRRYEGKPEFDESLFRIAETPAGHWP